ncbi:MAG TPA: peptidoglycan editing factor PgeF, partial [Alphaproteobacteria bacterium]
MHAPAPRLAPIEVPLLKIPGIRHAFFTRAGGSSRGLYAGLNAGIGSRDERAAVLENRARAARHLGVEPEHLATPYQVHGSDVVVVESVWGPGLGPRADAVVTHRPDIAVGVGTADCGPILFAEPAARIVAAAHAGWKGALCGILESAVAGMERLGADRGRIVAVLGPTISGRNYEVGPELVAAFVTADRDNKCFFSPSSRRGHAFFDLPAYIVARLRGAGVGAVHDVGQCTYTDAARFYSYRRATH